MQLRLWCGKLRRISRALLERQPVSHSLFRLKHGSLAVDDSFQHMTWSKHQYAPRRDRHFVASFRITPHALRFLPHRESSKGRKFHRLAFRQCRADFFQHVLDHLRGFIAREADGLEHRLGEIGAGERIGGHGVRDSVTTLRRVCGDEFPVNVKGIELDVQTAAYKRTRPAPQVSPPPIASMRTRSPRLIRPSATATAKASGTEAAEVLPCSAMVEMKRSAGRCSRRAVPSRMRWLA